MLNKSFLSSSLSNVLFLNINASAVSNIFGIQLTDGLYLPLKSEKIIEGVRNSDSFEEIPAKEFVEGMYLVIGCDEEFKYSQTYKNILSSSAWCSSMIKSVIAEYIKSKKYLDGYLLLRGLYLVEGGKEIYDKLQWCIYNEYLRDKNLLDELKSIIDHGKEMQFGISYFYESLLYNEAGKYVDAWNSINLYFSLGGERLGEIDEYAARLRILSDLEKGRDNMSSNPKYALELLLPLLDEIEDDAFLYYYIAVAYRHLGLHEKAIYYLNEAFRIDNTIVDIFNEIGLNYACLKDYDTAVKYFRKAFEVTKSVEICTNLIMCYYNKGDLSQANSHLELAKKIDTNDVVLKDIEKLLGRNRGENGD